MSIANLDTAYHVLSLKKIRSFYKLHAESRDSLLALHKLLSHQDFQSPDELRAAFPQIVYVKPFHVFNIGRAYRLIAAIHFDKHRVYIRHVLTHREYDRGEWKDK